MRTISIIGGGFSGTLLAARLLGARPTAPLRVRLIERRPVVGAGVAYAASDYPYLLNVPAGRMSATADAPREFLDFIRRRNPDVTAEDFLPRSLYGEYLRDLLTSAVAARDACIEFDVVHAVATDLIPAAEAAAFHLVLDDGRRFHTDVAVLCTGAPPSTLHGLAEPPRGLRNYISDPYGAPLDVTRARTALLVGTGLTMADIAMAAADQNPSLQIHALSRHGLLPLTQLPGHGPPANPTFDAQGLLGVPLRSLCRSVRHAAEATLESGGDWRDIIVALRPHGAKIWGSWTEADRGRFLRHVRVYWDIHRHRMPPQTTARMNELLRSGRLSVHAGKLQEIRSADESLQVRWKMRGTSRERTEQVDLVVNCTGATCPIGSWEDPLIRAVIARGLARPDAHGIAFELTDSGAAVGAAGLVTQNLHYVGPMLRARHWEATAVLELRGHVDRLAVALAQRHVGAA